MATVYMCVDMLTVPVVGSFVLSFLVLRIELMALCMLNVYSATTQYQELYTSAPDIKWNFLVIKQ